MRDMTLLSKNNCHLSPDTNDNDDTVGSNDDNMWDSSIEKVRDISDNF